MKLVADDVCMCDVTCHTYNVQLHYTETLSAKYRWTTELIVYSISGNTM